MLVLTSSSKSCFNSGVRYGPGGQPQGSKRSNGREKQNIFQSLKLLALRRRELDTQDIQSRLLVIGSQWVWDIQIILLHFKLDCLIEDRALKSVSRFVLSPSPLVNHEFRCLTNNVEVASERVSMWFVNPRQCFILLPDSPPTPILSFNRCNYIDKVV